MLELKGRSHGNTSRGGRGTEPIGHEGSPSSRHCPEPASTVRYVTRGMMEAECPGVYEQLPRQFRDRLPARVQASAQNASIFWAGFNIFPGLVTDLFQRLRYVEGTLFPMWKLVAAFYMVQARIGENAVKHAGEQIHATMSWPPHLRTVADALRFTETAYFESHLRAPRWLAGCWRVERETPTRMVLADDTPYPCRVNEGVVAGIARAFSQQKPRYRILEPNQAKRAGGTVTRYEITFTPD